MFKNNHTLKPYERLSQVYDAGWGDFSIQYVSLINDLLMERGINRARILDIACGTGILAFELAKSGYLVYGVDISPEMIKMARLKSTGLSNLTFDIQDMARLKVSDKYDLVACTFDSINYILKGSDLKRMLSRIASALRDKGIFIFDSNTKHLYLNHNDETERRELNGQSLIQHCIYNQNRNIATTVFSFSDGSYEIHKQRPYNYKELKPLLNHAGFKILSMFSWFEKIPYSTKTPKLFCVAEKNLDHVSP